MSIALPVHTIDIQLRRTSLDTIVDVPCSILARIDRYLLSASAHSIADLDLPMWPSHPPRPLYQRQSRQIHPGSTTWNKPPTCPRIISGLILSRSDVYIPRHLKLSAMDLTSLGCQGINTHQHRRCKRSSFPLYLQSVEHTVRCKREREGDM